MVFLYRLLVSDCAWSTQ